MPQPGSNYAQPSERGWFGDYGGRFVAETLIHALDELEALYAKARSDPQFQQRFSQGAATSSTAPTATATSVRYSKVSV